MELVLKTDLRAAMPQIIEFNYEELKEQLAEKLSRYQTMVVTEDGIKAAKADRATINKLRTAFEDSRKEVKADCLRPYDVFEYKIKELTGMIDKAIANIDTQVKGFEEAKKQEKRAKIEAFFAEQIGDLFNILSLERIWNSKWLNTTTKMADIQQNILSTIERTKNDIGIIRAMRVECETQMIDRYLQTLSMSEAMAEKTRFEEQQKRLAEYRTRQREQETAQQARAQQTALSSVPQERTASEPPAIPERVQETELQAAEQQEQLRQLDFRVWGTREQLQALKQFLVANHIKFGRVQ